jgi:hypothetical protein
MADDKTKEAQAQLSLEMQINQVLQSRMAVLKAQEKALSGQVALAVDLCKALKCEQLDDIEARLNTSRQAMEDAARAAGALNTELSDAGEAGVRAAEETTSAFDRLNDMIDVVEVTSVAFVAGLVRGLGSVYQTSKNVITGVGGIISALGKFGVQILAMPFNMLGKLFEVAQGTSGMGPSPIRIELEKLRGEFGDLSVATGKVAASALDQFRGQLGNVGKSGLSVAKIFGMGPEGVAAAMRENAELMKALGPAVDNFSEVLENNAGELTVYRKGMGLTVEQQAKMMNMAQAMGEDPLKAQHELAAGALNMQNQFGISAKKIAQDVATMQGDVANFGTMTREQMLSASVYTRKLGIELKSLTGLVSAFDDFENAANNAAKLSQAFGMNVDAMKMMQEQDPTKRLSMLQQAFKQSGKAVEQMNRSELKLLATQAGMDEETAKLAFSQRGLSMSYDQVQKASEKSKKKQMSQEQVLKKLADSIERVFGQPAQTSFTSFFDAFSKGFNSGITKSKEFKELMRAINASLRIVFRAGREVGKMFMALFPGIKETFKALTTLFSPERYSRLMGKVKDLFKTFFKDLKTDPKAGVEKFIAGFKKTFLDFFKEGGPLGKSVLDGGKTILKTFWEIFKAILPIAIQGLTDMMRAITDFIKQPGPEFDASLGIMFKDLLNSMIDLIVAMAEKLWPVMKEMFITIFERVKPWLEKAAPWIIGAVLVKVVLSGLVSAAWGAVTSWLSKKLLEIFTGAGDTGGTSFFTAIRKIFSEGLPNLGRSITSMMSRILGPSISRGFQAVASMISKLAGPVAIAVAIGTVGVTVSKATEKMGARLEETFGKTAMQQGIMAASVIDAITLGLLPDSLIEDIAEFTAKISSKMWKFFESFLPAGAIKMMKAKINTTFETLRGIGDIILGVFDFDIKKVGKGFGRIFDAVLNEAITFTLELPKLVFKGVLAMGEFLFKGLVKVLTWVLTDGFLYLLKGLAGLVVLIAGFGQFIIDKVVEVAEFFGEMFDNPQFRQKVFDTVWNFFRDMGQSILDGLWNFGTMVVETLYDAWATFRDYWSEKIGPDGVREINKLIDKIVGALVSFKDKFLEGFSSAWSAVTSFFDLSKLRELGSSILEGILSVFTFQARMGALAYEGWDKFSEFFDLSKLQEFAKDFIDGIADKLFGMLPLKYETAARLAWAGFGDFFTADKLMELGRSIVDGIVMGLGSLKNKFTGIASDAWNGVRGFFQERSPSKKGVSLGKNITSGITQGMGNTSPDMVNVFDVVFEKMVGISEEKVKLVVDSITGILDGMKDLQQSPGVINIKERFRELANAFGIIVEIAESIKDPAVYEKIGQVGETLNIFSRFASSFKDIAGLMPSGGTVNDVVKMITTINKELFGKNVFKTVVGAIKSATGDAEMFGPAGIEKIKTLGDIFKVLGDFTASLSEIKSAAGEEGIVKTMKTIADSFSSEEFGNNMGRIVRSISSISDQLKANPLLGKHVKNISTFSRNLNASITSLNNVTRPEEGLVSKVALIGESFLKLEEDMQRLGDDPRLKAVVKVGQSLKGNSKLTVKHEAVQINLNVDIKMDASKIGSGLIAWSDKDVPANRSERRFVTSERTNNFTVAAGSTVGGG